MAERMLKFVGTPQAMPDKRPAAERRRDFHEIYAQLRAREGGRAGRALLAMRRAVLPDPLPAAQQHPRLAEAHRRGPAEEAYELSSATNNLPEICGRICPQDRLCEGNCVIEQSGHGTVTIGSVEKLHHRHRLGAGLGEADPAARASAPRVVGIIGAGPAGLAAAEQLRRKGYQVTVYDRYDRVGGLLIYGIPNFKLEKDDRRAPRRSCCADGGVDVPARTSRSAATSRWPSCASATTRC